MKERLYCAVAAFAVVAGVTSCKSKSGGAAAAGSASPAAAAAGPNPLAMLNGFEGEIDLAIKDASKNKAAPEVVPIALQIKSDKVRAELPQGVGSKEMPKGHVVLNAPEKKLYVVMDEQKQIMVLDLNKMGEQMKSFGQGVPKGPKGDKGGPSKPPPKVTKTGVTDKVAGISCENWEVAEETRKVATLCIADQGASWFHLPITGIPTEYAWAMELMDGKHFPLRMIGYDEKTGAESGRIELTKLDKKPIAPAIFDMPPGYKVVDMGQMFAGLAGAAGAGGPPGAPPFGGFVPPGARPKKAK
jgi:hypothetical protein